MVHYSFEQAIAFRSPVGRAVAFGIMSTHEAVMFYRDYYGMSVPD